VLFGAGVMLAGIAPAPAADYRIDHIEVFNERYVNIHFDTIPNRTYTLQYRSNVIFTNVPGTPTTGWSNLFVAPAQPFQNHYVVSDFRTNHQRYYRLRVTP
jgi:hypothetical protein